MLVPGVLVFLLRLTLGAIALRDDVQHPLQAPHSDTLRSSGNTSVQTANSFPKPFYMIAHRVLTRQGVQDALINGANAIEIDMRAEKDGWYADHDGTIGSQGDTALDMFKTIADARKGGQTVTFVWLDIKNPDECDPKDAKSRHCSIDALRDLARQWLEPQGVRVLYGFSEETQKGNAYLSIRDNLSDREAINLDGQAADVARAFEDGPANQDKRVMSYGWFYFPKGFGDCHEKSYQTCTELRMGAQSGNFGKVFGWTVSSGQAEYVNKVLDETDIDGLIYGRMWWDYVDNEDTRSTAADIVNWVKAHPDRRIMATNDQAPWH
ncbi:putative phospholipase D precursor [Mycena metata]|uniref:Phospholipase D n=1 Tax=Mycena metata TaxID=1033252 RepID=A0AAD7MWG7_9AGAR|nr:putative phospholipase D precursor [Mycena metata]